jgi:hypothetical protein
VSHTTQLPEPIRAYRADHPRSRAVRAYTLACSSGTVRRAQCIYCRRVIATCSAAWPMTKTFVADIAQHFCDESLRYTTGGQQ